ncbi:hypothetical protein Tco_1043994 [Tanacetum coccineum]|uniref:RNA-directed DNA polymerase, eukaryota n=1 Tax=Tanacetum coccineum TaxID=301880 RepID=A0ABQ5GPW8_9ASTR
MTFVKWDNVLASKEKGGLGLLKLSMAMMVSLAANLAFRQIGRDLATFLSLIIKVLDLLGICKKVGLMGAYFVLGGCLGSEGDRKKEVDDGLFRRWGISSVLVRMLIDDKILEVFGPKTRWIKYVPIKVNILAWRIKLDYLPTRLNLSRRDLNKNIARWWDVNMTEFSSYEEWWNWFSNLRFPSKLKMIFEGAFYITWCLLVSWMVTDLEDPKPVGGVWSGEYMNHGFTKSMKELDRCYTMLQELRSVIVGGALIHKNREGGKHEG